MVKHNIYNSKNSNFKFSKTKNFHKINDNTSIRECFWIHFYKLLIKGDFFTLPLIKLKSFRSRKLYQPEYDAGVLPWTSFDLQWEDDLIPEATLLIFIDIKTFPSNGIFNLCCRLVIHLLRWYHILLTSLNWGLLDFIRTITYIHLVSDWYGNLLSYFLNFLKILQKFVLRLQVTWITYSPVILLDSPIFNRVWQASQ